MHSLLVRTSARPGLRLYTNALTRPWHRPQSSNTPQNAWKEAATSEPPVPVQENLPKHSLFVLHAGRRFIKFSFIGLALLGVATASAYEGAHIWAEKIGLAPETGEVKKWEWESDADKWTGDPVRGGTDPGLGLMGRHLVRAAWMAYTWGIGHRTMAIGSYDQQGVKVINTQFRLTEDFLRAAIRLAELVPEKLFRRTLPQLFVLHGSVLEKLGNDFLPEAKSDYDRAWSCLDAQGLESARIALKLGDIASRLGSSQQALEWWARTLQIINGKPSINPEELIPKQPPSSPLAQRLLSSTLVSLSAFYAKSGQYHMAELIEDNGLSILRAISPPSSLSTASPPQALHALYLLQRSSILSTHLAEVQFAQHKPAIVSMQWLTFAAESSERVARALTGLPLVKPQEFHAKNSLPHPLEDHLLTCYSSSRSMKPVAEGLLRDARRTVAGAWNLMGMLHETAEGSNSTSALGCFERAVEWAGTPSSEVDGEREAAEGIPDTDWKVIWGNYQRALRRIQ